LVDDNGGTLAKYLNGGGLGNKLRGSFGNIIKKVLAFGDFRGKICSFFVIVLINRLFLSV